MHGRVLHIEDLVTYGGESMPEVRAEFVAAVERYLAHCKAVGKQPDKPYSGSFNVRLGAERHKKLAQEAHDTGHSINEVLCEAVDGHFAAKSRPVATETVFILREEVRSETVSASKGFQFQPADLKNVGSTIKH